jgi:hypothetical protein
MNEKMEIDKQNLLDYKKPILKDADIKKED